ncbi:MAG: tetratricopeptide repeat protein, partial [Gammaproteobacteria bacterium]
CLRRLAALRSSVGQHDAAIEVWTFLNNRDPLNSPNTIGIAIDHWFAGRLDSALDAIAEARGLNHEDVPSVHALEAMVRVFRSGEGDLSAALEAAQAESVEGWRLEALATTQYALGNHAESDEALGQLVGEYAEGWPYNIAVVYAFRGEHDRAFEWLERAIERGDSGITIANSDPTLRKLHADPRWLPFLTKIGQSPEQLARVHLAFDLPSS